MNKFIFDRPINSVKNQNNLIRPNGLRIIIFSKLIYSNKLRIILLYKSYL